MREWRFRKSRVEEPSLEEIDALLDVDEFILVPPFEPVPNESNGARTVREYLERQAVLLRRATVLKMLRRGMDEAEIVWHFYHNDALRRAYVDSSLAPMVALRRDFEALKGAA